MTTEQIEAFRKKSIGDIGENIAIEVLTENGYSNVINVNANKMNETFGDVLCEKDGERFIVSVKARNKYQIDGKLNGSYKISQNPKSTLKKSLYAEDKYNAIAAWMAIQIDFEDNTASVYFGKLSELEGKAGISMRKCQKGLLGEILQKDKKYSFDSDFLTNQVKIDE